MQSNGFERSNFSGSYLLRKTNPLKHSRLIKTIIVTLIYGSPVSETTTNSVREPMNTLLVKFNLIC